MASNEVTRGCPLAAAPVRERELFEELSLGVLSARQSTNYRGLREVVLGPEQSARILPILRRLHGRDADVLEHATHTHVVLRRPYRTPFTFLLTFIGHRPLMSLGTVAYRAWDKKFRHADDIPTINYLTHLHVGVLADAMERAAVIASHGRRKAQVFMAPFCGEAVRENANAIRELERIAGLSATDRAAGWRVALVTQVGEVAEPEQMRQVERETWRKLGANLMAFRSERIQPGVNAEERAPEQYQHRQDMDVPDELTVQCGRALYNAFVHWTGAERERSKALCLLERVDVLTLSARSPEALVALAERYEGWLTVNPDADLGDADGDFRADHQDRGENASNCFAHYPLTLLLLAASQGNGLTGRPWRRNHRSGWPGSTWAGCSWRSGGTTRRRQSWSLR